MAEPRASLTDSNKNADEAVTQEDIMEGGGYVVGRAGMRRSATLRRDGAAPEHQTMLEARHRAGDDE